MGEELVYEVGIGLLPGIGNYLTRTLISYCGSAKQVWHAPPGKIEKIPGIGPTALNALKQGKNVLKQAEAILAQAQKEEVQVLFYTHKNYPDRLKQIADAPTLLYYKGNCSLNQRKIVSIVGTRKCTSYGKEITEQIVKDLTKHQALILSGLAYGIDIAAHRAATQYNLPTVGVMANGLDTIYPAVHRKISEKMLENGGLLSENTFGTKPDAHFFPARNRIIAGMADVTIIVESAIKGGTLITADIAHSYNKDIMAVPGPINSPVSAGCNYLIKSLKAAVYTELKDLEELLNWDLENGNSPTGKSALHKYQAEDFTAEEFKIIQVLQETKEEQIDTLSWKTQVPINQISSLLLGLEFKGVVKALPGKKFSLI
ncbi:MAG: DNA-processing protein DprA [Adhaeribacter sp.]